VDAVTKGVTGQLDYVRPLGKVKLETGEVVQRHDIEV
jgi:hypothetical protein